MKQEENILDEIFALEALKPEKNTKKGEVLKDEVVENLKKDKKVENTEKLDKKPQEEKVSYKKSPEFEEKDEQKVNYRKSSESEEKEEVQSSTSEELEILKKQAEDNKAWGHQQNRKYFNAKKNITQLANELHKLGNLHDDDLEKILSSFDSKDNEDIQDSKSEDQSSDPISLISDKLEKEFSVYKKYTKIENAEEKYGMFFYLWPMLNDKDRDEMMTYLQEAEPDQAIDYVMSKGSKYYNIHHKGIQKSGGFLEYANNLADENKKLKEKVSSLSAELDDTTETRYSRSINSRAHTPYIKEENNDNMIEHLFSKK